MQKLIMAPSFCYNLREHWLITIQIGPNDEGTPEASQTFPLHCTVQQSRAHSEEGSAFCVLRLPACLQIPEKRCPQLGVGEGRAYCCVEVAQEIEKNPVGISTSPSQLAVKTGRSGGDRADSLCPISCLKCLKLHFQLMRQGLEAEAVGSCTPEMTKKLKCIMKSSKAFRLHSNSSH